MSRATASPEAVLSTTRTIWRNQGCSLLLLVSAAAHAVQREIGVPIFSVHTMVMVLPQRRHLTSVIGITVAAGFLPRMVPPRTRCCGFHLRSPLRADPSRSDGARLSRLANSQFPNSSPNSSADLAGRCTPRPCYLRRGCTCAEELQEDVELAVADAAPGRGVPEGDLDDRNLRRSGPESGDEVAAAVKADHASRLLSRVSSREAFEVFL
jgi:hypothetical protein